MKKLIAFLCSILVCFLFMFAVKEYYSIEIEKLYSDKFVAETLTEDKFKSIILSREAVKKEDNLFLFGSSELESSRYYGTHPIKFFNNKNRGFQVNLIGDAGYKCLVHAVKFGDLGRNLRNQKVAFILSPQWFVKEGITENTFEANSSEYEVCGFLLNPNISKELKRDLSKRILQITRDKNPNKDFESMRDFCRLYTKNKWYNNAFRCIMTPYYWGKYELLSIKDEIKSYKFLKNINEKSQNTKGIKANIDWKFELKNSVISAKKTSHNKFGMDDKAYKSSINKGLKTKKGFMKKYSYKVSHEYDDFKLLLDICKEQGIKPLIISIPVNGKWYDYCEFNKEDRELYYNTVNKMTKSYGFDIADFSGHEYEDYFLKDGAHLGWKGWVYVNEALDRYYNQS